MRPFNKTTDVIEVGDKVMFNTPDNCLPNSWWIIALSRYFNKPYTVSEVLVPKFNDGFRVHEVSGIWERDFVSMIEKANELVPPTTKPDSTIRPCASTYKVTIEFNCEDEKWLETFIILAGTKYEASLIAKEKLGEDDCSCITSVNVEKTETVSTASQ